MDVREAFPVPAAPPSHAAIKSATTGADTPQVISVLRRRPAASWLLRLVAGASCALLVQVPVGPAQAEDAASARAEARAAALHVRDVQARLTQAQADYAQALSHVGQQVSDFLVADAERADAERDALAAGDRSAATARALYLGGGQAGLLNTLLTSGDVTELAARLSSVQQVLTSAGADAQDAARQAQRVQEVAAEHAVAADASVVTAAQLTVQAAQVAALLADAQGTLDHLSLRARQLTEAEEAARALARARAAAALAQSAAVGEVRAQVPPAEYFRLYHAAALTCRGLDWTLLAAVGQVESGHGRNVGPSVAGAVGPMQFMPGTFAAYAVDGDRDGVRDPFSPADSIYTAARYLCTGGAGSPSGVRAALFRYNRAQWYVDLILGVQARLQAEGQD